MKPDGGKERRLFFGGVLNEGKGAVHDDARVIAFGVFGDGGAGAGEVIVAVFFTGIGVAGFFLFERAGIDEGVPGGDF